MRRESDRRERAWRAKATAWLVGTALIMTGFNTVLGTINQRELNSVQNTMRHDATSLEVRRFHAEKRACGISQDTVRNERRIITRSMNAQRRDGLLNKERLNFFRATLKDLVVPTCTPTSLGFPKFEPPNTPR